MYITSIDQCVETIVQTNDDSVPVIFGKTCYVPIYVI